MTTGSASGRLTRTESRQRTREALVIAAMEVFARDGYAGASVDRIAEQAGYTIGALYSNFATKEKLFLAAFERHCGDDLAALTALVEATSSTDELMQAVTARFATLDARHQQWWQLWAELWLYAQRHPEGAKRLTAVQDETRAVIARALRRDGGRVSDEVVAVVHALWTGFMLYRLVDPRAVDAGAFGRAVHWLIAGAAIQQNKTTKTTKTTKKGRNDR
jgi:AcrR family transcriptional regulator